MAMNATTLGNAMYDAAMAVDVDQDSVADGELGKQRFIAIADAIIEHIKANATIAPLTVTETPIIGTSVHVHDPIATNEATGKIS